MTISRACLLILGLAGCASQSFGTAASYVPADGSPVDLIQMKAVLAQCQSEGAIYVKDHPSDEGPFPWLAGMVSRSSKEDAVINACMARNGYLAQ